MRRRAMRSALVALALASSGCIGDLFSQSSVFDKRPLTVQVVDLFNQRTSSRLSKRSWRGDWIFRRDRLELIDLELKNNKPDLLLAQGVMARIGSPDESDRAILSAGALADYMWRMQPTQSYTDTYESESMAVAASVPSKLDEPLPGERDAWGIGANGYLMAATVEYENQLVTVFNVQMPTTDAKSDVWYDFVKERITEKLRRDRRCAKRVVVGGFMPGDVDSPRLGAFLRGLGLKDVATGFCQVASRCYTATPTNDLFMATVGDENPTRTDKLFVHESAYVYASARDFDQVGSSNRYTHEFGLPRLWPTQRFGWVSQVRLARCAASDVDQATP